MKKNFAEPGYILYESDAHDAVKTISEASSQDDSRNLRLRCLEMVVPLKLDSKSTLELANKYYEFIIGR